jgi:hypothetical protein
MLLLDTANVNEYLCLRITFYNSLYNACYIACKLIHEKDHLAAIT